MRHLRRRARLTLREAFGEAHPLYGRRDYYLAQGDFEGVDKAYGMYVLSTLLVPAAVLAFRVRIAWLLATTPENGEEVAPWDQPRRARYKALLLLCGPIGYGDETHDSLLILDHHHDGYGWSATTLTCPPGWKTGRLGVYTDGESTY